MFLFKKKKNFPPLRLDVVGVCPPPVMLAVLLPLQPPANVLVKAVEDGLYFGAHATHTARPGCSLWLLALTWLSPGYHDYLGAKSAGGSFLSVFLSL